ncbi:hypothetical protein M378DRAFT_171359 [Amanita muscaria Koide BX008]|uniref:Uncharacterized protein n=1 Tax=Amanita muscaria (strain Koide BX008) TaxID=946122 RepID=A0A0C2WNE5_AMAMK|nr:hypothetical protein M378DRAFT_171359 [Amanita muscaria Koide BX008]
MGAAANGRRSTRVIFTQVTLIPHQSSSSSGIRWSTLPQGQVPNSSLIPKWKLGSSTS